MAECDHIYIEEKYKINSELNFFKAAKVTKSIYLSNWYEYPKYAKDVLPIMIRNQKPLTITAGGFVMIDLKMFMAVCTFFCR